MITLFLEKVVSLEAGAEAIESLAGLPNPESDGVESPSQGAHPPLDFFTGSRVVRLGVI